VIKIATWNVNGIRSAAGKGLFSWMASESADVVCIQETKADPSQLGKEFFETQDSTGIPYATYWASAKKRGYSGVALYSRQKPDEIRTLGIDEFDDEGRYLEARYGNLIVASAYFPNSQEAGARLEYKLSFCEAVLERCDAIVQAGQHIVLSGDYNIAHEPIDLAYPSANEENPGYLPEERAWMSKYLSSGYVDTFRRFHPGESGHYSWWSYRTRARERDIGWRLDYHCIDASLAPSITNVAIRKMVLGSDHCPVIIELDR